MSAPSAGLNLFVVAGSYPSRARPAPGAFVRAFVHALVREGAQACVASPVSMWERRHGPYPDSGIETTGCARSIHVLRPIFPSFSVRRLGSLSTASLTQRTFEWAAQRALASAPFRPSATYGHFLYQSGSAAAKCARTLSIPSFVAVGEGTFWTVDPMGDPRARRDFADVCGFIAVSSPIRDGLIERFGFPAEKIGLFPNGVDRALFRPGNRLEARRRLGIPGSTFVIAFVGAFDHLKGGARLVEAARGMTETRLLLVGEGPVRLESPEVLFGGGVPHDAVPGLLAAADVFALPTLEEGSCNSILEAMACGLPIVTATGSYMDDLVDESVAFRVAAMDVAALRVALERLRLDPARRTAMAAAAEARSSRFDICARARGVLAWMTQRMAAQRAGGLESLVPSGGDAKHVRT